MEGSNQTSPDLQKLTDLRGFVYLTFIIFDSVIGGIIECLFVIFSKWF